jgi:hypothetical protein
MPPEEENRMPMWFDSTYHGMETDGERPWRA